MIRLSKTVEKGGCSAKLGPRDLEEIIKEVPFSKHPDLVVGPATHDDAGVIRAPDGSYLIQTTDFFPPMIDDPYEFGQVAAANALSDVYAMGGRPISALSLVMFPSKDLPLEVLKEMLKGGTAKVEEAGAIILGGHTIDDAPLKFGLAVTGRVQPDKLVTNAAARPGDILILTKPLGTGIVTGARKVDLIEDDDIRPAVDSMTMLNDHAAEQMAAFGAKAATDITGFGLLGHAYRLADASGVTFRIESGSLPVLPKALELIELGAVPGGAIRNLDFVRPHTAFLPSLSQELKWLAVDPQTSGGLLISIAGEKSGELLDALKGAGLKDAAIIGEVHPPGEKRVLLA